MWPLLHFDWEMQMRMQLSHSSAPILTTQWNGHNSRGTPGFPSADPCVMISRILQSPVGVNSFAHLKWRWNIDISKIYFDESWPYHKIEYMIRVLTFPNFVQMRVGLIVRMPHRKNNYMMNEKKRFDGVTQTQGRRVELYDGFLLLEIQITLKLSSSNSIGYPIFTQIRVSPIIRLTIWYF